MNNRVRFTGSHVLITGAGSGIGRLMAIGAARRGARVTIWDLSEERGTKVRDEIRSFGGQAQVRTIDITDRAAVDAAAADTGTVDILINNAGIVTGKRLLDSDPDAIQRTFAVNTLSLYWMTRAFLGGMLQRDRGTVVTVASAAGLVGVARQTDYSASKFAAFGFNESLRAELRTEGSSVRTLIVCPFYVNTGMFEGVKTKYPFLLPILDEDVVAEKILTAVSRGKEQLIMPGAVRLLPSGRMFPVRGFDAIMNALGVNRTMDHFVGRRG
ncbi:all-trans-retinol dehydrogenase (NAD+) [Microbacterium natoriense]|uniref:All-trans-retinol dehydrogenase (NAD+) n=1 Tax=Microbacterium natoriense TaxID=284570 RepID=A0AAW8ES07_9MICO|nr:SDR family oxidoreductase [Microbacterium natoriense]MDQ0646230.1 all-trans-retinol dehydrogenase (NAD+) [Microbacterium natoriense]